MKCCSKYHTDKETMLVDMCFMDVHPKFCIIIWQSISMNIFFLSDFVNIYHLYIYIQPTGWRYIRIYIYSRYRYRYTCVTCMKKFPPVVHFFGFLPPFKPDPEALSQLHWNCFDFSPAFWCWSHGRPTFGPGGKQTTARARVFCLEPRFPTDFPEEAAVGTVHSSMVLW